MQSQQFPTPAGVAAACEALRPLPGSDAARFLHRTSGLRCDHRLMAAIPAGIEERYLKDKGQVTMNVMPFAIITAQAILQMMCIA